MHSAFCLEIPWIRLQIFPKNSWKQNFIIHQSIMDMHNEER